MRVMGIDPGSNCTGFGVVEEVKGNLQAVHWSSVKTSPKDAFPQRIKHIYDEHKDWIQNDLRTVDRPFLRLVAVLVPQEAK